MRKRYLFGWLFICLLSLIAQQSFAQTKTISGIVQDENNNPLIGATVTVKNSAVGTSTNANGSFSITIPASATTLVVSSVGFGVKEIAIGNTTFFTIKLSTQAATLTDVVVVAYGQQKKESVTAAITSVNAKQLVQSPVANLSNALAGRLTGLSVLQTSGKPGEDAADLYVRGIGTYAGNTQPLILVDGIVRDSYNEIDPNEVETISILKDASATAVYGVRGANGVILITTKRGQDGVPKINVTAQTAITEFTRLPKFVNSYQYATLKNEQAFEQYWADHANDADVKTWADFVAKRAANWVTDAQKSVYFTPEDIKYYQNAHTPTLPDGSVNPYYDPYFHPDQDWQSQIFKKFAQQTQANMNIRGGTSDLKYFVSLGYLTQGGLFKTDFMPSFKDEMDYRKNRYNLRTNFDYDVNKNFRISVDLSEQYVQVIGRDNDGLTWEKKIMWATPMGSPGIIDGKFAYDFYHTDEQRNPLYAIVNNNYYNITNGSTLNSSIRLTHKLDFITKGLSVSARGAYDSYFSNRTYGRSYPVYYGIRANPNGDKLHPILVQMNDITPSQRWGNIYIDKWRKIYTEASINYNRSFGGHTVTGLLLGNLEKRWDPDLKYHLPHGYEGLAGRVTYAYKGRYLAEYNIGYNGSENFAKGKRFDFFPAYSLGWVVNKESFWPQNDYVTFLKLRGSLGKVGNDVIGGDRYMYLPDTWQYNGGYWFGVTGNRTYVQGAEEAVLGNPNLTWETATKWNVGFETKLFKDKLSIIFDHFNEHRVDILSYRGTVPSIVAATLPPYNLGEVKNQGNELEIAYNSRGQKFDYWVKGNISTNKNEIVYMDEAILPGLEYQAATGKPIGQGKYLQADGLYTSWAQLYEVDKDGNPILSNPVKALNAQGKEYTNAAGNIVYQKDLGWAGIPLQPGEVKLKDVNFDGVIDDKDYMRSGKTGIPNITYGLAFGFSFKGFDFSVLFQGAGGVAKNPMPSTNPHFNKLEALQQVDWNRFTPERYAAGEQIDFPIAAYNKGAITNTFFLINTAYTRLKNMEIGYTFQRGILEKAGINSARIYVNGYNLHTWSSKPIWGDPENLGYLGYPLTRTFNAGLNFNF